MFWKNFFSFLCHLYREILKIYSCSISAISSPFAI